MRKVATVIVCLGLGGCAVSGVGLKVTFSDPSDSNLTLKYPAYPSCSDGASSFADVTRQKCAMSQTVGQKGPL